MPAFIIDAVRSPFGRHGGALAEVRADDLLAHAIAALVARTGVPADQIDDVIAGCANQAGEDNRNVARMGLLLAGLPVGVPGVTVNRLCGSGMQAVNDAARLVAAGEADLVVACGVEHMTRAPFVLGKPAVAFPRGEQKLYDTMLGWRFVNPRMQELHGTLAMGETAEAVAERYQVTREAQDRFALGSQEKAARAVKDGRFVHELAPLGKLERDEQPRPDVSLDGLGKLKPVFKKGGTVTAGNSSGINDGAAAVLVASEAAVRAHDLKPMARWVASGAAGVEPSYMGLGPIPAGRLAMERAGIGPRDLDVVELNEAFAAQAIPCVAELGLDPDIVNPNGGAIALGHPLGASGARLVGTLAWELELRKLRRGMAAMCIGVGQGIACILERA